MPYLVLYRKYRSQTFGDLEGQAHVVRTLQNGILSGRIAHSYLLTGPRGTGKTSTARLLAKCLNCEKGPAAEPCNVCEHCIAITNGNCIDVIEMDAASESGVENVRSHIVAVTEYQPMLCRYKVFIIDEVHDLSRQAFDALLKTIEEPPPHVVFVLATTDFGKVPPTIRARCQKLEFHLASVSELSKRLQHVAAAEGFDIEPPAITAIARLADGGYRDALTLLEQAMLTTDGVLTLQHVYDHLGLILDETIDELLFALKGGDTGSVVSILDSIFRTGRDPKSVVESLMFRLGDLTRAAHGVFASESADAGVEASSHDVAVRIGMADIVRWRTSIAEIHSTIREITLPRLWLEAVLLSLIEPAESHSVANTTEVKKEQPIVSPEPIKPLESEKSEHVTVVPETQSDDPALDDARTIWHRVVEELAAASNLVRLRLAQTELEAFDGGRATVVFSSEVNCDWLVNSANRRKLVADKLAEITDGEPWKVTYTYKRSNRSNDAAPATVELPAEGEKLADLAEEVFKNV